MRVNSIQKDPHRYGTGLNVSVALAKTARGYMREATFSQLTRLSRKLVR